MLKQGGPVSSSQDRATSLVASTGNPDVIVQSVYSKVFSGFAVSMTPEDAEVMAESDDVDYISPNGVVTLNSATWGLDRVDQRDMPLDGSFTAPNDGSGVTAYIIDTGIYTDHNEFGGRATWGVNFADDRNEDCDGHGTHVAGTVGGKEYGVAKNVDLVAVKVFDCSGFGSGISVINAMEWVMNYAKKPATVNLSLGAGYYKPMNTAATALHESGIPTVVAAGNEENDACDYSPASAKKVITVGATNDSDERAWFSNYGGCVNIFAPGYDITSAWIGGKDSLEIISGTSMAAPHVCGAAALLLADGMDPSLVADALYSNATPDRINDARSPNLLLYTSDLDSPGPDCIDSPTDLWFKREYHFCGDLTDKQCRKFRFAKHCPIRCGACANKKFVCGNSPFEFKVATEDENFKCMMLKKISKKKRREKCAISEIFETCRKICGYCRK